MKQGIEPSEACTLFQDEENILTVDYLGGRLISERQRLNHLTEQLDEQQAVVSHLEDLLYEQMTTGAVNKITLNGVTLTPQRQYWASVSQENPEGFAFLERYGLQDLIRPTVNSQTLSATVRQFLEVGTLLEITDPITGEPSYYDLEGKVEGVNITAKKKILIRGLKSRE